MNLRIVDGSGLVEALDHLLRLAGEPVQVLDDWTVATVEGAYFYQRHSPEGTPEVGGPYPTFGALVKDAGRQVAASAEGTSEGEPVWEVRAWGGSFFALQANQLDVPTCHAGLEAARVAAAGGSP